VTSVPTDPPSESSASAGAASTEHAVGAATADPAATGALIHARGLTKRFGDFTAVDGIDFDVAPGEAFGFLGPNGAGKTSTMRMIGCVSPRTQGTLQVPGLDPDQDGARIRAKLGVVPQPTISTELTSSREPAHLRPLLRGAGGRGTPGSRAPEFVQLADRRARSSRSSGA
jgi:lipooligosaccharide transport system ATP-binding protein